MHCFRDAPSLHQFLSACPYPDLFQLIGAHLEALAAFDDVALGDLVHFFILDPGDTASALALIMGRNLADVPIEACLVHAQWFELVMIVSDDGFGHVVFIPKTIDDQWLVDFCVSLARRTTEDMP